MKEGYIGQDDEMALELLVRMGRPQLVLNYAYDQQIASVLVTDRVSEARIYALMRSITEYETEFREAGEILERDYSSYFHKTENTALMADFLDILQESTEDLVACSRRVAWLDLIVPPVAVAIKSNETELGERAKRLANAGYNIVLDPYEMEPGLVEKYFPVADQLRELVDLHEVASDTLERLNECFADEECDSRLVDAIVLALTEMVPEDASRLAYEKLDHAEFSRLVEQGLLSAYAPPSLAASYAVAIDHFLSTGTPIPSDLQKLGEELGAKGRTYLGIKMGEWLRSHRFAHLQACVEYQPEIYDRATARVHLTGAIAEACAEKDYELMCFALGIPAGLVDLSNDNLNGFSEAYLYLHSG